METIDVELYVGYMNNTWGTFTVTIPNSPNIEEEAIKKVRKNYTAPQS